jgi:hypothetical protein
MFLRDADYDAYKKVLFFEILLRRVIRWEARGIRGRQWLGAFGPLQDRIEDRIKAEKSSGSFNPHSSELSYLSLSELLDIIFDMFWRDCFQRVLGNKKHMRGDPCRGLNNVRNKVAHFRPVNANDAQTLAKADYLLEVLESHYKKNLEATAYLPGDFDRGEDQLDEEQVSRLTSYLKAHDASAVWDDFQVLESVRATGLSPGIGVVSHHVFYELYTRGAFGASRLVEFLERNKHVITFMNVGTAEPYIRIFMPIALGGAEIRRLMKKVTAAAQASLTNQTNAAPNVVRDFDLGYMESLGAEKTSLYFGFVF